MSSSIFKNKGLPREASAKWGFTLTELLVVIGIAVAIMTALIIQQSNWNDQLTVSTQAYELALMIRQAQIYSLGVRENAAGSGDKFDVGYGIYFDQNYVDANGKINRYVFFADKNDANKGKYIAGVDNIMETKILTRGVVIDGFCGVKAVGQKEDRCAPGNGNVSTMVITFFRPDPKANVLLLNGGGQQSPNVDPPAKICLKSSGDAKYQVNVESNGQVSLSQNCSN